MSARRIFISSVMRDFGNERVAARSAVESLRQQPVMAEDFGAQPFSSQTACLDGVQSSDIYIGIFGPRYGSVASGSGLAATEEEFNEARSRGLPILCFEQKGDKDPEQGKFLTRIKAYETGYAFAIFESSEDLKLQVVKAVNDLIGTQGISMLDLAGAVAHLDQHTWGSRGSRQQETSLGIVLLPVRQGESYLDVLEFGQQDLRDRFLQPARFGAGMLFQQEAGVQPSEKGDALIFKQEEDRKQSMIALEIHADATLVYSSNLRRKTSDAFSMLSGLVIDEGEVERQIAAFCHYANQFYLNIKHGDVITSLYMGASMTNIQMKSFGQLPGVAQSVSVPMHGLPDPLKVPSAPLRISRADLANPSELSKKLTGHIARAFRNANAYLTPSS